ncbi:env [Squirrel monkey simian foamy virus]|uniref:Envelope glycoprotein gp130 n=1 Tax=Squirrel monkey simian foamy virus TaxID=2170201 RepID=D5JWU7_9RETR|nr:env [Squirrel monkey simian foamy virus]ADE05996.1 env [Squirrel monkey simian foamy virus]
MARPMTLHEWLKWKKTNAVRQLTENLQSLPPEQKELLIQEIEEEDVPTPSWTQKCSYMCYLACATTTRIMGWIIFTLIIASVILVTCFVVMARIQWRNAITVPGIILDWNSTSHEVFPMPQNKRRSARDLIRILEENIVEINTTSLPQGILFEPHPKPIIGKERVLGLSQVILINSESIATSLEIKQEHKHILVEMIKEELLSLQNVMLNFDLPLGDPKTQQEYISQRCFQEFKHCYLVAYNETQKPWPTDDVVQDMCPLPGNGYSPQNAWDYYLEIKNIRPENWTSKDYFGSARMGGFWVPPWLRQNNYTHVLFCSDQLYEKWYIPYGLTEENDVKLMNKLKTLLNGTNKLKARALSAYWHPQGQNKLFRNITRLDYCKYPEAVILLNTTKSDYSLWEGDCNIWAHNITVHPACKNFNFSEKSKVHPYTCRHWRFKEGPEQTKCLEDKTQCLYYSEYSSPSYLQDFGWLAYQGHFPSPICEKETKIRMPGYTVYSLFGECLNAAQQHGIERALIGLHAFMNFTKTPLQEVNKERAFIGLDSPKWPPTYPNITIFSVDKCKTEKRKKREIHNWGKLQAVGFTITNTVSKIARIIDLNNEHLVSGLYLLKDHLVTLMESTLHDISILGNAVAIQHFHTHLTQLKLLLMENRMDWTFIDSSWIQDQLKLSDEDMKILRRASRALVYKVEEIGEGVTSTIWEIGIYYEIIIPRVIYSTNWKIMNLGHLVYSADNLVQINVEQPYEILNVECGKSTYLHIDKCEEQDYVICEVIQEKQPCGNQSGSDCPVKARTIEKGYTYIQPLKNGSYVVMSHFQDCHIKPYIPQIVTVNATVKCLGEVFQPPLVPGNSSTEVLPVTTSLKLQLPHLVGIITKLKGFQVQITSTWESIKGQVEQAQAELLRLDLHEGDSGQWIKQLASASKDIWPAAATVLGKIGDFLGGTAGSIFGIFGYLKPIFIGLTILILIVLVFKILSWLPTKRKAQ